MEKLLHKLIFFGLLLLLFLSLQTGMVTAEILHFTVLHTSDEHSSLMPVPLVDYQPGERDLATGGFARLATLIKNIRDQKQETPVLLLSSGDFTGGTPFSWLILKKHSLELEIMHSLGYNAVTIGNHEFDYGPQSLADYFSRLRAQGKLPPIIASNLLAPAGHAINDQGIHKNLLIHTGNGLKIGIFALLGRAAHRVSPDAKPLDFADQHKTAHEQVEWLKKSGAQVIIALTHSGIAEDRELAATVPGIHLILGGHDHLQFDKPEMASDTLTMHSGYYTQTLSQLDLAWNTVDHRLSLCNQQTSSPILHQIDSSITEHPETAAIIDSYRLQLNEFVASLTQNACTDVTHIVARSDFELTRGATFAESTIGNFITDAMRIESEKVLGEKVDFAVQANGVIRGGLQVGRDQNNSGNISLFDLISISAMGCGPDGLPGHPLVSLYLSGNEIYRLLEIASILPQLWGDVYFLQFSGLRYTYDIKRTFWIRKIPWLNLPWPSCLSVLSAERLVSQGEAADKDVYEPISADNSKLYHLVTSRYLATYLPMIGARLPKLKLGTRNRQGQNVSLDEAIIRENRREFKIWEATTRYIASFAPGSNSLPLIPERYRTIEGRITAKTGQWLWLWPALAGSAAFAVILLAVHLFYRSRSKR